jgi:lactate permease
MLFAEFLFEQNLNPLNNRWLSTLLAALPVVVLLLLLVKFRVTASLAGAVGSIVALVLAVLAFGMPMDKAAASWVYGACFGLLPIGLTVFGAMMLYNFTVATGQFAIIRRSIGALSGDARIQSILIGFAFGAFMEGAAGAGSPVAICGAMLVGLGVPPFRAAVICLIANTSPVCYGGLGVPILTLDTASGISADTISVMCGHQLPILSCIIPLYMVKCLCSWKQTLEVWPALLVGGGSFALFQYTFATFHVWFPGVILWPLTDIGGGLFSLVTLAIFLKFCWKPKTEIKLADDPKPTVTNAAVRGHEPVPDFSAAMANTDEPKLTAWVVFRAWSPFLIMAGCLVVSGILRTQEKRGPVMLGPVQTEYKFEVPTLHKEVVRAEKLRKPGATADQSREEAIYKLSWITAPGAPVIVATLISALLMRVRPRVLLDVLKKTISQMKVPIPTIACMLGLSYVTKYAGMDATLGVAFAETGILYPFFAAILGWLGVFLTGTDAGSNALFGSLQKITAGQIHDMGVLPNLDRGQAEVLICTANSTGGVMGKMIDAQSICVATAGTNQVGREADLFKAVIWHSILLASVVGLLTCLQAFVPPFTMMVPKP